MRAALYARVSDISQVDNWSIPAQEREFTHYCEQKGWTSIGIYREEGRTARADSIDKRPELRRLLNDCRRGMVDVVVVHSLDRWSRNLRVTLETFKQLADRQVTFSSITENIDYSTPEGRLFIAMIGAFAQYFSDNLAKHTSKGMRQRAISGLPNGDVPFGYRWVRKDQDENGKGYVITVQAEAEAVKQVFRSYVAGGWSLADLAAWLNGQRLRTRNKRQLYDGKGHLVNGPQPFTGDSVRWILHNRFYTGKVKYRGVTYDGTHEALIDERLFDAVQERLRIAKGHSKTFSKSYRQYLLKGIIRCIYCGYPLWSETSTSGYSYYREKKHSRGYLKCPGNGKAIRCDVVDGQVDVLVRSLTLEPSWKERIIAKLAVAGERENILKQRNQTEGKLRRLARSYIDGLVDEEEYQVQKRILQDHLNSLVMPETDAAMDAGQILETLGLVWDKATLEERHRLLFGMLEAVYVDLAASRGIVGIQPRPAFRSLFEVLRQQSNSQVIVFSAGGIEATTGSGMEPEPDFGMVETGESRTPRPKKATQDILQA